MELIRELLRLQHRDGHLTRATLIGLADRFDTPQSRVEELVSFFPHLRTEAPREIEIEVCQDLVCQLRGACELSVQLTQEAEKAGPSRAAVHRVSCLGRCDRAPAVRINEALYAGRTPDELVEIVRRHVRRETPAPTPDLDRTNPNVDTTSWQIEIYKGAPDFRAARTVATLADRKIIVGTLECAGLLGMGGPGARTFKKWQDVLNASSDQKFVICNADESEPATFKDREILLRMPHLVVEGIAIAALTVGARQGYVYIRHEYPEQILAVQAAIAAFEKSNAAPGVRIEVFHSPGGYICGEQTALVEAMESHRAEPRNRPPQLETNGLWGKPTLLNNVETLAWVPAIVDRGAEWYYNAGRNLGRGRRFFSICGDVNRPGVYEVPIGLTLGELIDDHAGGMRNKWELKAIAPSGPSGGFLPARIPLSSLPRDFDKRQPGLSLRQRLPAGATHLDILDLPLNLDLWRVLKFPLAAGMIVYGQDADLPRQALNALEFYRRETCGKCVPCRIGTQKLVQIGSTMCDPTTDAGQFKELARLAHDLDRAMGQTAICGLGHIAAKPLTSLLQYFGDDVTRHLADPKPVLARTPADTPKRPEPTAARRDVPVPAEAAGAAVEEPVEAGHDRYHLFEIEESIFARDLDGQLIRYEEPTAADYEKMIPLKIDGRQVMVPKAVPLTDFLGEITRNSEGETTPRATTIYDAVTDANESTRGAGNPIPILCHQPHLRPVAVCRVCSVLLGREKREPGKYGIQWDEKLSPACQFPVDDKGGTMIVITLDWDERKAARLREWLRQEYDAAASPADPERELENIRRRVQEARQSVTTVAELLIADHIRDDRPFDHSPYNELWALGERLGADAKRFRPRALDCPPPQPDRPGRKEESKSLKLAVDHDACILCDRCIRGCADIAREHVIGRTGKGGETLIGFNLNIPMNKSSCVECGECLISCPTSAITALRPVQSSLAQAGAR